MKRDKYSLEYEKVTPKFEHTKVIIMHIVILHTRYHWNIHQIYKVFPNDKLFCCQNDGITFLDIEISNGSIMFWNFLSLRWHVNIVSICRNIYLVPPVLSYKTNIFSSKFEFSKRVRLIHPSYIKVNV